jgi:hypothetical protein
VGLGGAGGERQDGGGDRQAGDRLAYLHDTSFRPAGASLFPGDFRI